MGQRVVGGEVLTPASIDRYRRLLAPDAGGRCGHTRTARNSLLHPWLLIAGFRGSAKEGGVNKKDITIPEFCRVGIAHRITCVCENL